MPVSTVITHKDALDTIPMQAIDSIVKHVLKSTPEGYVELNKSDATELLSRVDMDALISSFRSGDVVYNGFLGDNHYRVELYLQTAVSDSTNPFLLKVSGKSRYKKNVIPFTGIIDIAQVYTYKDKSFGYQSFLHKRKEKRQSFKGDTSMIFYHAKGTFTFAEDSSAKGSGIFSGKLFMDFGKDKPTVFFDEDGPDDNYKVRFGSENSTRKAGVLMEGQWQNHAHTSAKSLIAAKNIFMYSNDIMEELSFGDRGVQVSLKYRSLGWDDYYKGEEWWNEADSKELGVDSPN
jgi:hypothetical protein